MGGGDKHPTTPGAAPKHSSNGEGPHDPSAAQGKDVNETWNPMRELGLLNIASGRVTCLGKTWDNKRCRRGPSANNNRPCSPQDSSEIRGHINRLAELPVTEVATRRTDLLLNLAEAMMCLKEPDEDSEWRGHQPEQAAAQAFTWRRQLTLKANFITVSSVIRPETYVVDSSPSKRRNEDDSPSPANKRQATTADDDNPILSPTSTISQTFMSNRSDPTGSSPSTPRFGNGRVRTMPQLPPERLAHGVRMLERRLQEKDAIIRHLELELRETRADAERLRRGSSQSSSSETIQI